MSVWRLLSWLGCWFKYWTAAAEPELPAAKSEIPLVEEDYTLVDKDTVLTTLKSAPRSAMVRRVLHVYYCKEKAWLFTTKVPCLKQVVTL
jgi:hypothetical protein